MPHRCPGRCHGCYLGRTKALFTGLRLGPDRGTIVARSDLCCGTVLAWTQSVTRFGTGRISAKVHDLGTGAIWTRAHGIGSGTISKRGTVLAQAQYWHGHAFDIKILAWARFWHGHGFGTGTILAEARLRERYKLGRSTFLVLVVILAEAQF